MSKEILLVTLNSSYVHSAFGLRYLYANLKDLQQRAQILEMTIASHPRQIVEKVLTYQPKIVGFGVYIWNAEETLKTVSILKKVSPETIIVLGGPEVSFEAQNQKIVEIADHVIQGEADFLFYDFCKTILIDQSRPTTKIIRGPLPEVSEMALPYSLYTDDDVKNRVIYVEVSRGCPFKCEYCLSSLDKSVRNFPLETFLNEMDILISRGVKHFKFVDRTFNLSISISTKILQFFLDRMHLGLFIHFEMIPDRLPSELRELIQKFPPGSLQFEIGIQTFDKTVQKNVARRNDFEKVAENFRFLCEETKVHTHADLIVGLPGETLETFALGFNQLVKYKPDEIQIGILKRLKGTPIIRHEREFAMVYSEHQPFEILSTSTMSYQTIQNMQKFAKFWDLYSNSGNFKNFVLVLKNQGESFFDRFFHFSQMTAGQVAHLHSLSQEKLVQLGHQYLVMELGMSPELSARTLMMDYCFGAKRRDLPVFLREFRSVYDELKLEHFVQLKAESHLAESHLPERQARHLGH